jgi:hypothetical protein
MDETISHLLSIAEITGVFLGFSALISLVQQSSGDQRERIKAALINLVLVCLMVIVSCMLPLLLFQFGTAEKLVWAVSAGITFSLNICLIFFYSRLTVGWTATHRQNPVLSYVAWGIEPFFQAPLVLCIFPIWTELGPALYLTALVAAMMQTALLLTNIVVLLLHDD